MLQSCISSYLLNHLMAYQAAAEALGRPIQKKINVFLSKLSHCHAHDFYRKSFTTWSKIVHKKSRKMTTWKPLKISLKIYSWNNIFWPLAVKNSVCIPQPYVKLLDDFSCSFCMELWKFSLLCSCRKKYTSLFVPTCYVSFGRKLADFEYVKCFHLSISSIFILFHPHHLLFSCHFLEKYWQNNSFKTSYLSNLHYLQWSNLK